MPKTCRFLPQRSCGSCMAELPPLFCLLQAPSSTPLASPAPINNHPQHWEAFPATEDPATALCLLCKKAEIGID